MSRLERMEIAPGVEVLVEVPDSLSPRVRDVAAPKDLKNGLYKALEVVEAFGRTAAQRLKTLAEEAGPDEMTIEWGVGVSAGTGVVLVSASSEATLKVTMTWKKAEAAKG